jgi:hypothetical protein
MAQLNVRISEHTFEAITAAVYVRKLRSPQQLLGPLVEEFAAELLDDPAVADAMRLRDQEPASNVAKLERLRRGPRQPER